MAGPRAHHGLRHEAQADPSKDRRAGLALKAAVNGLPITRLVLKAAVSGLPITRLVLFEPPYGPDDEDSMQAARELAENVGGCDRTRPPS
jgi:hypothetical protein